MNTRLLAAVREIDTASMTTAEVSAAIHDAVPDAQPGEIIAALRLVAAEQLAEAEMLEAFYRERTAKPESRCQRCGL